MIELGGGGEVASRGSSQCTQETDKHIQCGCGSALRTRRNGLAALISEGNAYALLTHTTKVSDGYLHAQRSEARTGTESKAVRRTRLAGVKQRP